MACQTAGIADAGIHAARAPRKWEAGARKTIKGELLVETMYGKGVPALFKDLQSNDWRTRAYAAHALDQKKIRAPWAERVANALAEIVKEDTHWWVKVLSIEALAKMNHPCVIPALIGALRDKNHYVAITASSALGKMGDPATVSALRRAISKSDDQAHKAAMSNVLARVFARRETG